MIAEMPIQLIISWIIFFGFVNTHQRHARTFRGASQNALIAIQVSSFIGSVVGLILLLFYWAQVVWYWPVILFLIGSIIGGLLFGYLDAVLGQLGMTLIAFIGWPAAAVWTYYLIRSLQWIQYNQ